MRCFVTGASGHLGVALTYELLRQGQEVAVLLRPSSSREALKEALPRLKVIEGDLARVDDLGNYKLVTTQLGNHTLMAKLSEDAQVQTGPGWLSFPANQTKLYAHSRLVR